MECDTLMCTIEEVKPSKHREFGTVLRIKLSTNITQEHLGLFCNLSKEFESLFGNYMAITSATLKASSKSVNLKFIDSSSGSVFANIPAQMALSKVKESDEETPNQIPASLFFITELKEDEAETQHALSMKLKQNVQVEFSETQAELFHTLVDDDMQDAA